MSHEQNRGKKDKRKPPKQDKKRKGLPPHLERGQTQQNGTVKEIQRHMNDLEERKK